MVEVRKKLEKKFEKKFEKKVRKKFEKMFEKKFEKKFAKKVQKYYKLSEGRGGRACSLVSCHCSRATAAACMQFGILPVQCSEVRSHAV
jgi:hypothetical protein